MYSILEGDKCAMTKQSRAESGFSGIQGAQVGILRRVIRVGASEKVTVEQRLEGGERVGQADNRRMAVSRSMRGGASEPGRGGMAGAQGVREEVGGIEGGDSRGGRDQSHGPVREQITQGLF